MRVNKYLIKYTVPNILGKNEIFYTTLTINIHGKADANWFMNTIFDTLRNEIKKNKDLDVGINQIDLGFVNLLDSEELVKERELVNA